MKEGTVKEAPASRAAWEELEEWTRHRVQGFIQDLLEEETTELLGREKSERRAGVDAPVGYRNGHGKPRRLSMKTGTIAVRRPRVRGLEERFESRVLPLFERRTAEVAELLPDLYLHGLSTGDFELALRGLLGNGAPLSATSIERLKAKWEIEYLAWRRAPLGDLELVYVWADGIHVKAGLDREKAALLVVVGALRDGRKVILAVVPGHRESTASWAEVLRDLKARGLEAPRLVAADGCLGIWGAAAEVWPEAAEQRCWNHKIVNVLDKLPKKVQAEAREMLTKIPYAPTRAEAKRRRDEFALRFRKDHPEALSCLDKDWEALTAFYDFPAEHWKHLRTTNIVESPFAAVRLRTDAAKRFKKVPNATALIWRVLRVAESRFRRLDAAHLLADVYDGRKFVDGRPIARSIKKVAA